MKKLVAVSAALVVGAISASASAQTDLSPFGVKGTFAIDAQGGTLLFEPAGATSIGMTPFLGWSFRHQTDPADPARNTQTTKQSVFYINPGVDYFVIDNLSIGGEVLFGLTGSSVTTHPRNGGPDVTADGPSGTYFGIMPRVGYNIPLSSLFSIWPRGGIGLQTASFSGGGAADSSNTVWFFFADVPFLLHPVEHFFIGAGPGVTFSLSHSVKQAGVSRDGDTLTDFRLLSFVMGGYF
jgi:hypothetical protein